MRRILFFDDYPNASENTLLMERILRALKGADVRITPERTIPALEEALRRTAFDIIILDIMAESPTRVDWPVNGHQVPETLMGIAVLDKCRAGKYGNLNRRAAILMRSARGENHIMALCTEKGATAYYRAGSDDTRLVEEIARIITELSAGGNPA